MSTRMSRAVVAGAAVVLASLVAVPVSAAAGPTPSSSCTIEPTTFPDGNVGTLNSWFFNTTGCRTAQKPIELRRIAGQLPPGTQLFTQGVMTGGITGTPTTEGLFTFTIRVKDSTGATD